VFELSSNPSYEDFYQHLISVIDEKENIIELYIIIYGWIYICIKYMD